MLSNHDFSCCGSFTVSHSDKVTNRTESFVLVNANVSMQNEIVIK